MHRFVRFAVLTGVLVFAAGAADAQIDARLLRQPDVSAAEVAFVYGGDIWVVSKEGGLAHRLSTPMGEESFPRFSPDGQQIAFTGNYDGNQDIFVMPAKGGLPTRLTHHPGYSLCDPNDKREATLQQALPGAGDRRPSGGPAGAVRRIRVDITGWGHSRLYAAVTRLPYLEEVSGWDGARDLALRSGRFSGEESHTKRCQ